MQLYGVHFEDLQQLFKGSMDIERLNTITHGEKNFLKWWTVINRFERLCKEPTKLELSFLGQLGTVA